jgi:hypothetical protein
MATHQQIMDDVADDEWRGLYPKIAGALAAALIPFAGTFRSGTAMRFTLPDAGFDVMIVPSATDDPADALDALTDAERAAAQALQLKEEEEEAASFARWKAAKERRKALCEKIAASLVDVLKASPPDIPPDEQVRLVVGESVLTLTSEGVIKQDRAAPCDIPF